MKKTYLILTALTLTLMGLIFALDPNRYLAGFGAAFNEPNQLHVIRSFGGFYLGFAGYLLMASRKENLVEGAVLGTALVMSGFLVGRIVSLWVDGLPDPKLWVSLVIELIFAIWGFGLLLKSKGNAHANVL